MTAITERVEKGAALLDEKRPGWWQEIDLGRLELRSPCNCVLGQIGERVYGPSDTISSYADGLYLIRLDRHRAYDFGFDGEIDPDDYERGSAGDGERAVREEFAALTAAWRGLILDRRAAASVTA